MLIGEKEEDAMYERELAQIELSLNKVRMELASLKLREQEYRMLGGNEGVKRKKDEKMGKDKQVRDWLLLVQRNIEGVAEALKDDQEKAIKAMDTFIIRLVKWRVTGDIG